MTDEDINEVIEYLNKSLPKENKEQVLIIILFSVLAYLYY